MSYNQINKNIEFRQTKGIIDDEYSKKHKRKIILTTEGKYIDYKTGMMFNRTAINKNIDFDYVYFKTRLIKYGMNIETSRLFDEKFFVKKYRIYKKLKRKNLRA